MNKRVYSLIHVIIIIVITAIVSGITTGVLLTKNSLTNFGVDYGSLMSDENVKTFLNAYSEVTSDYYQDVDKKAVINSAISGMLEYLNEPYTTYLDDNNTDILFNQLNGTYEGIGISITDNVVVSTVLNSPADKAGVLAGDILYLINDVDVSEKTASEITEIIKNSTDDVKLVVKRNDEEVSFNLKIETLDMPLTEYKLLDNNVGYLRMTVFGDSLTREVTESLKRLENQGMAKLIIDVRNNTGGYLDRAYEVSSLFIAKGKVIYGLQDRNNKVEYKDEDNNSTKYPIVVLVNEATASAAEILTAALKDSYGATIVGTRTFGKGKVQHTYRLNTGGMLKYTSSNWLRPSGECIDGIGITPDFTVENEYTYDENGETITGLIDYQLSKAIELLSK